jgi:CRP/FNR family transcriptional regulator, cyclic AMP receptor protein
MVGNWTAREVMGYPEDRTAQVVNRNGEWRSETFVGRLQEVERRALFELGESAFYSAGGHLLVEGDRSRFVLILHGGPVKIVQHNTSGREHLLGIRGRGDLIGELSYLDNEPRSASAVTLHEISVTKIGAERFSRFLAEHPRVGVELARYVGTRLRDADRSRLEISTDDMVLRVARVLHHLAQGSVIGSPPRVIIPLTQRELAQVAYVAEVTVNRVLRNFRAREIVRTGYGHVEVPCLSCFDRLLRTLSTEQQAGKDLKGCGGRNSHDSR